MGNSELQCSFCGRTNTKIIDQKEYSGIFGQKERIVGRKKVIDNSIGFYRCVDCGRFLCSGCIDKRFTAATAAKLPFAIASLGIIKARKTKFCLKCGSKKIRNV